MSNQDLRDLIAQSQRVIEDEYRRGQRTVKEDPGTAGDQGEENWAKALRSWLPHTYHVKTKGRILNRDGKASRQVDVVVLYPEYPPQLLDQKLFIADGVAAAFECKLTLRASHLKKILTNAVAIRELLPMRLGTPRKEIASGLIYGCLAHSHEWTEKADAEQRWTEKLESLDANVCKHPRNMLDVLCIADLAAWVAQRTPLIPALTPEIEKIYGKNGTVPTAFLEHSRRSRRHEAGYTPMGAMLTSLFINIAWEDPRLRRVAENFRCSDIAGDGRGTMRLWEPEEVLSPDVFNRCKGRYFGHEPWNEWGSW